ncbi:MAG: hypothetical protein J5595_07510, partial [Bacteroidales bacterium]|nr:hypothetical protein [Bacteroidales bacterium]
MPALEGLHIVDVPSVAVGNKEELALIIWDQDDPNLFIGANKTYTKVRTFVIIHNSLHGPFIRTIKELSSIEDIEKDKR